MAVDIDPTTKNSHMVGTAARPPSTVKEAVSFPTSLSAFPGTSPKFTSTPHTSTVMSGYSSAIPGSSSAATAALFAPSVPDDDTAPPVADELDESEPGLEELLQRAPLLRAQLISMVRELDSWCSLMQHHKSTKGANKE